ncbi:MAG: hypothetical protein WD552_01620 [Candidatus Paceibacterota bacterium]
MRTLVSTKRKHGLREYAAVSTRGEIEAGIVFHVNGKKSVSVESLKKALETVPRNGIAWDEPQTLPERAIEKTAKVIYFPVQLSSEESETAGNESVREHISKVERAGEGLKLLEKQLETIPNDLWKMRLEGVSAIAYVCDIRSTLT